MSPAWDPVWAPAREAKFTTFGFGKVQVGSGGMLFYVVIPRGIPHTPAPDQHFSEPNTSLFGTVLNTFRSPFGREFCISAAQALKMLMHTMCRCIVHLVVICSVTHLLLRLTTILATMAFVKTIVQCIQCDHEGPIRILDIMIIGAAHRCNARRYIDICSLLVSR